MARKYMIFGTDVLDTLMEKDKVTAIMLHELARYSGEHNALTLYLAERLPGKIAKNPEWERDHALIHRCVDEFHDES